MHFSIALMSSSYSTVFRLSIYLLLQLNFRFCVSYNCCLDPETGYCIIQYPVSGSECSWILIHSFWDNERFLVGSNNVECLLIPYYDFFSFNNAITQYNQRNWVSATNSDFLIPIFASLCCRPLIFQTINSVRLNSLSLKYKMLHSQVAKIQRD